MTGGWYTAGSTRERVGGGGGGGGSGVDGGGDDSGVGVGGASGARVGADAGAERRRYTCTGCAYAAAPELAPDDAGTPAPPERTAQV